MPQRGGGGVHWQGTQRRACAPGAHWNVQVVRGKVTTRCLWHACKALGIGLLLMLLGACMATIGYYADQLSMAQEIRGNLTVRVKNESRGFHLNNLSYAGPIVMGVGGFIVVAACVMTFEARDSAAKVVPARFRFAQNPPFKNSSKQRSRRSTSCQTTRWDHQLGLFRVHRSPSPSTHEVSRKQLTAELMQFSKNLHQKNNLQPIKKSPSAPNLVQKNSPRKKPSRYTGCALLNAELLKRYAMSVDNAGCNPVISRESLDYNKISESQVSMAMDLHIPNKGSVTLKIKDRSDTAQRHQLLRQTKVDEDIVEVEMKHQKGVVNHNNPQASAAAVVPSYSKYPDDFISRRRNSIDIRLLEELEFNKRSPKDFRKISSPNFRKMSLDRIGGDLRKSDRILATSLLGCRKASLDCRKSPDLRNKRDYRKCSMEKCGAVDCSNSHNQQITIVDQEFRPRADTGETVRRYNNRHGKQLYHSRSDDNRRRSFDKHRSDSQCSRFSLNNQSQQTVAGIQDQGLGIYELKYFTATNSLDTDGSRADGSDDSHTVDIELSAGQSITEGPGETDALLEEPELENLTEVEIETSGDDIDVVNEFDDTIDEESGGPPDDQPDDGAA